MIKHSVIPTNISFIKTDILNENKAYIKQNIRNIHKYKIEKSFNFIIQKINVISFNIALDSIIKEESSMLEKKPYTLINLSLNLLLKKYNKNDIAAIPISITTKNSTIDKI